MARIRHLVLAIGLVLGSSLAGGCLVGARGTVAYEVDATPPPPRHVYVDTRPGYVWIDGNWQWDGGRWAWVDGYYQRERVGYVYVQGRWDRRGGRHHWVPGRWVDHGRRDRGVVVRDNRAPVIIRDHRKGRPVEVVPSKRGGDRDKDRDKDRDHRKRDRDRD